MQEKYRATLIGTAIGDTIGMSIEGWNRDQIKKYVGEITGPIKPFLIFDENGNIRDHDEFGKLKFYSRGMELGSHTDDTILTLALAESIASKGKLDLEDIAERQLHEYLIRTQPDGNVLGGFGGTTRDAFKRLIQGISPYDSGVIGAPGNGPAMKMSPVGLFMEASNDSVLGITYAKLISKITHLDPRSTFSGQLQANNVHQLLSNEGLTKEEFLEDMVDFGTEFENWPDTRFTLHENGNITSRLKWILENKDNTNEDAFNKLGNSGLVYESYPFVIFMFQKYWDDPNKGILEAISWGGDADTVGAMYGALAGAKNGMVFPKDWLEVLQGKDRLIAAADGIYDLRKKYEK